MSSEGTCFENLLGKRGGERILQNNLLPFLLIKNSVHLILILYLHEKFEKTQVISVMSMGQAGPQVPSQWCSEVMQYHAIRHILFSSVFTYLNVSPVKKKSALT